ncbi:hypothetical protein [Dyadobacter sandarakinus]|uniref:LVIVD repeat-containing protein n=1 Tax=Dyadobacter sandarakinus TaxID=2747268 RepID=A0ABX7I0X0_9BACT|nr:hypothetical protein [Dyadobacter sandarakinus]QRQ99482.1 hypothetical protein HWI92_00425 [Dyadobacter sandarakinus]
MKHLVFFACLVLAFSACFPPDREPSFGGFEFDGTGYRPVYASAAEVADVKVGAPQPLLKPGKMYVSDPYLFVNDTGKGIHIINNADPAHPEFESFISIPGNYDMAVKGQFLYADNYSNLIVFNIRDPEAPTLAKTLPNAIPVQDYPPFSNIYFECVDKTKGYVIAWEKVSMDKPKCYR